MKVQTIIAAATVGTAISLGAAAFAEQVNWKMAHFTTGGPHYEFAQTYAEKVRELSGGEINIEVFPAGTLGAAATVTDTVSNGVSEVGFNWMGYDWGRNKATVLFSGYPAGMNDVQMLQWLNAGGGRDLQREFRAQEFDVVSFPAYLSPAEIFLHSNKPIESLEDMAGLKFRTAGAWLEMSEQLGAAPVTAAGSDVYPMLERGVIDATEWSTPATNVSAGFQKIARYVIVPGIHQPASEFEVIFNQDAWDSLSDHQKVILEKAATLNLFTSWSQLGYDDIAAFQEFEKSGNEIITLTPEVQDRVQEISRAWADEQAASNDWFAKIYGSQSAFRQNWASAKRYRDFAID
ncbi:TRAP transporter substrate-binding protein DctP [Ruegeria arenilitoris]|uniref:TRAP transporter substrate-binding protein DctP n=1 Tax=Ruegeria arenilitoris TaxID=1173585 RepID=UPI001481AD5A|nr:TRAP transporter substrate-binding protein DctP [Ruegeria arenilitoris]